MSPPVLVGLALAGLCLLFWLPAHIDPPAWAYSESYEFGFNNKLFQRLFVAFLAAAAALAWFGFVRLPRAGRSSGAGPGGLTRRLLLWSLGAAALLAGLIFWLAEPLGALNDGSYFISRINFLDRGMVPFRDFEWLYGTAPLYTAYALHHGLHFSVNFSYQLLWFSETLLGVWLLWLAVRWIDLPSAGKRTVYVLFGTIALLFILNDALNYCMLRYSLPLFALTGACRLEAGNRVGRRWWVLGFTALMAALLLNFSPEEGLVFGVAVAIYFPVRRAMLRQPWAVDALLFVASYAALVLFASHLGAFRSMAQFGAGSFHLPIYPGPPALFMVSALLTMVVYVASGVPRERVRSNTVLLTLYGIGVLPAVLGRCDVSHIEGYLLPVLICFLLLVWQWPTAWRVATAVFAVCFIAFPVLASLFLSPPELSKAFLYHLYHQGVPTRGPGAVLNRAATRMAMRALGPERGARKMASVQNAAYAPTQDPRVLFPGSSPVIAAPFLYTPNKLSPYQAPWIAEGYYAGNGVMDPKDMDRQVAELRDHPERDVLMSPDDAGKCVGMNGDPVPLMWLLEYPFVPLAKHHFTFMQGLCTYVQSDYDQLYAPSPRTFGYGLYRRKPGT